jgi:hypothetical protein
LNKIDLSGISAKKYGLNKVGKFAVINLFTDGKNPNDAAVYGQITVRYLGNGLVEAVGPDMYDFDIKRLDSLKMLVRNSATMGASIIHGSGKPFTINFKGKGKISP